MTEGVLAEPQPRPECTVARVAATAGAVCGRRALRVIAAAQVAIARYQRTLKSDGARPQ